MNLLNTVLKVKTGMAVWETEWFEVAYPHDGVAARSFWLLPLASIMSMCHYPRKRAIFKVWSMVSTECE